MFDEIGKKIKGLAVGIFAIGIFTAIITCITSIIIFGGDAKGILIGIVGAMLIVLFSWISTWRLYGYGEIVDKISSIEQKLAVNQYYTVGTLLNNSQANVSNTNNIQTENNMNIQNRTDSPMQNKTKAYRCPKCNQTVYVGQDACVCGAEFDWKKILNI